MEGACAPDSPHDSPLPILPASSEEIDLDATAQAVEKAAEERKRAKAALFSFVLRSGTSLILIGLLVQGAGGILSARAADMWLDAGGALLSATGLVIISTVPLDQFDMDEFFSVNLLTRRTSVFVGVAYSSFQVYNYLLIPPAMALFAISVLAQLVYIISQECRPKSKAMRFTTVLTVFVMVVQLCAAFGFWFIDEASCHRNNTMAGGYLNGTCAYEMVVFPAGSAAADTMVYINIACAVVHWLGGLFLFALFLTQVVARFDRTKGRQGTPPTLVAYLTWYVTYGLWGVCYIAEGISIVYCGVPEVGHPLVVYGTSYLFPILVVAGVGRQRLFGFMARRFESKRAELDGAVFAALLDGVQIKMGSIWWIHRDEEDASFPESDPHRHWHQCTVQEINKEEGKFGVLFATGGGQATGLLGSTGSLLSRHGDSSRSLIRPLQPLRWVPLPVSIGKPDASGVVGAQAILNTARDNLHLMDGEYMTRELMASSSHDESVAVKARRPRPKERIDFFLSHSWHDSAHGKSDALEAHRAAFESRHNRLPTYWLDKVCIDQTNITDGLRVLVANVLACKKVLVVCGNTYSSRLWCILELFTLFSFSDDDEMALNRVEILPIEEGGVTRDGVIASLVSFRLEDAHCYDPNEEARIRDVMAAVGEERFVNRIRSLGRRLQGLEKKHSNKRWTIAGKGGKYIHPENPKVEALPVPETKE